MNKTKKEIYEDYKKEKAENIQLKKYLKFWLGTNDYDADISEIDELKEKTNKILEELKIKEDKNFEVRKEILKRMKEVNKVEYRDKKKKN